VLAMFLPDQASQNGQLEKALEELHGKARSVTVASCGPFDHHILLLLNKKTQVVQPFFGLFKMMFYGFYHGKSPFFTTIWGRCFFVQPP